MWSSPSALTKGALQLQTLGGLTCGEVGRPETGRRGSFRCPDAGGGWCVVCRVPCRAGTLQLRMSSECSSSRFICPSLHRSANRQSAAHRWMSASYGWASQRSIGMHGDAYFRTEKVKQSRSEAVATTRPYKVISHNQLHIPALIGLDQRCRGVALHRSLLIVRV